MSAFSACASPAAANSPEAGTQTHRLQPGDELEITVVALPDQSRIVTVRDDGGIYMPLFGNVSVRGLTVDQLRDQLENRLRGTLRVRTVMVGLRKTGPRTMVVLGEVSRPGQISILPGATLADAVALAGGTTATAGLGDALLVRGRTSTTVSLVPPAPGTPVEKFLVAEGDVLYVRTAPRVTITGDVLTPGTINIKNGSLTVWNAIMNCGGPKPSAALHRVLLSRADRVHSKVLNLEEGPNSDDAHVELAGGDVVTVPGERVFVLGAGKAATVPLTGKQGLMEILVTAGVGDKGSLTRVDILRDARNPDGSRKVERVNLNRFLKTGVFPKDLAPLEDGDIVVVNAPPKSNVLEFLASLLIVRGFFP